VPNKVQDLQALLDNTRTMNQNQTGDMGEIGAADFQTKYSSFLTFEARYRNAYIWSAADDFYQGDDPDWNYSYQAILFTNLALEGIINITRDATNSASWDNVKGSALFFRAFDFYNLAQQYCKPYTNTAATDLGIPLRINSDINQVSKRSTVKETYDRIIQDLNQAKDLLPIVPSFKTRPSKAAVYGLLARVYLSMRDYPNALVNANACLATSNKLIDYSTLDLTLSNPVPEFNDEVIFHSTLGLVAPFYDSNLDVVPDLLNSYSPNDLRLKVFFNYNGSNTAFIGSYDGSILFFSGLAVDEILLISAECNARSGNIQEALTSLNTLLKNRYPKTGYLDFTTQDKNILISKILLERRKELCFRGLRWADLRRLNQEDLYKTTLVRVLNNQTYQIPPNDLKYVLPFDNKEIVNSGIQQNPRK
jgi:hypothetical protein